MRIYLCLASYLEICLRFKVQWSCLCPSSKIAWVSFTVWCLRHPPSGVEGQGLRARLCCHKISDSIFWLHCFTPCWLAGFLPKESPKRNIEKEKIETDKRRKHFFHTFLYLLGEGTNQRHVLWRSVVPKTPDSKNDAVGSTDTAWKRKMIWFPFSRGKSFFLLRMRYLLFRERPLGVSSNLIVFFLSIYLFF